MHVEGGQYKKNPSTENPLYFVGKVVINPGAGSGLGSGVAQRYRGLWIICLPEANMAPGLTNDDYIGGKRI